VKLVLLGDPVAHSRSPAIHEAALAACGIEGRYVARRVDEPGLYRAVAEIRAGALDGANVTMPHKRVAAAACDRLSPEASACRSVNTVVPSGEEAVGHSTDVSGIRFLAAHLGCGDPAEILVLGAGGAAAAALVAFAGRRVFISTRRADAAVRLAASLGMAEPHPWGEPRPGAVLVNATPLGMAGEPLPDGIVEAASALLDMPYGASVTPAVALARRLGIPAADGIDLLVAQAADSFRLWTGIPAPLDVMEAAARPQPAS
jgi:shikimate dehydrogenase